MNRNGVIALGVVAVLAETTVWHGPIGAGDRLAAKIETHARTVLDHLEMTKVSARLERGPLRRRLVLSGPADDFQRAELVEILDDISGVSGVRWDRPSIPPEAR